METKNEWRWRNPLPQGNTLRSVTYGNGKFVAVGQFGTIMTSVDGDQWLISTTQDNNFASSCIKNPKNFITSKEIEIIVKKYNPFYENTRYPVQKKRPKNGQYTIFYPFDIQVLDYFVLKMREVMPYPNNMWDMLKNFYPPISEEVFNMFKKDNVYYTSQDS